MSRKSRQQETLPTGIPARSIELVMRDLRDQRVLVGKLSTQILDTSDELKELKKQKEVAMTTILDLIAESKQQRLEAVDKTTGEVTEGH